MFKRKDKQDVIHQTNVKRGITSHFARTLKVLQQRHLQTDSDEFIYSDDDSNNLCSALEAVFLHGLKDSVVTKMSSYVGLASAQDQAQYINFWGMCAKFTHSDVIVQLRNLAQINTDIGLCRAWVRLALNDGLMESYLHSMIVDHKVLAYYYHSHSYLRDHEQPGILKNFLTGLMSLSFKLSFNSSVLNSWNNTSLQLSGLLDSRHVPQPALSKVNTDPSSSSDAQREPEKKKEDPIIVTKSTKSDPATSQEDGFNAHPMFSTIQDVEEIRRITQAKMGASGGNGSGAPQSVASEGSTSSHISCPDPSSNIAQQTSQTSTKPWVRESDLTLISPALYPRGDRDNTRSASPVGRKSKLANDDIVRIRGSDVQSVSSSISEDQNRRDSKSSVIVEDSSPFFDLEIAMSPPRPRSRRVTEDDLKTVSPASTASLSNISTHHSPASHSLLSQSPKSSSDHAKPATLRMADDEIGTRTTDSFENDHHDASKHTLSERETRTRGATFRGYEEICATLPPIKLDPLEQEAILKKVLGEIDEQADREREKREEQRINMSYDEAFEDLKRPANLQNTVENEPPLVENNKMKVDETDSGMSVSAAAAAISHFDETAGRRETREKGNSDEILSQDKVPVKSSPEHTTSLKESTSEPAILVSAELVAFGVDAQNDRAASMDETESCYAGERVVEDKDTTAPEIMDEGESSSPRSGNFGNSLSGMVGWSSEIESSPKDKSNKLRGRTRGESFASMLKTYAGEKSLISTTLDQVIQTFYGDQNSGGVGGSNSPPSPAGLSAGEEEDMVERQDSCLEDFEVLSPTSDVFYNVQQADTSRSIFLFRIPREHGLSHQNFICRGCSRPIGIIYGQPRLCEFDGGLYCYECHENNEAVVPSYIVYNWDFSKRKVAVENFKFLQALEEQALYDLDELNPKLETHVPDIGTIKVLRQQLCFLKSYMFNCTQKVAESLRQRVWPREHLYERATVYSVNDFHQVQSGVLMRFVKDLVKFASKHVYQCSLCSQKGFVCEICRNPQVIFPFELDTTIRCSTCKSVYHKTCMTESLPCPKCERWGRRNQGREGEGEEHHPEDYGMSPSSF